MTITLTTFVAGTKAKAEEVNANFTTLKEALESKADLSGNSTQTFFVADATSDTHAVSKSQLSELSDNLTIEMDKNGAKFCARSGYTTTGAADLFTYSTYTIIPKIAGTYSNLIIADYLGLQTIISSMPDDLSLNGNTDGNYNIFITSEGKLYALNNTIYKQALRPSMVAGDIWLNTSVVPFTCIKYTSSGDETFSDVPLGMATFADNAITAIETFPYNVDGFDINTESTISVNSNLAVSVTDLIIPDYANAVVKTLGIEYTAETNGYLCVYASQNSSSTYLYIDNFNVKVQGGSGAFSSATNIWPVAKGSTYKLTGTGSISFLPMKGIA